MIHVIAAIHVREGRMADFLEIFKANVPLVLQEKGCREYVPTIDMGSGFAAQKLDGNVVTVIEKWDSLEDLQAHMKVAHMVSYHEKTRDIVENVNLKVLTAA
ncbi:putative quinol monooxygenase [Desulfopila aestuarii]|uniref:Quinol monooxygenase YgiN n=1 Tax=Desulfopila aestuarii DSM 18488 TaxID=1121416 RepID=A0A1M7YEK8_9BACT|nr:antibiotic biosynthesis monooxygenase family protein [Desulfopila aestuarii]SHO50938.1 Quinol monooxygenase YgiN [Desulfopila aestuarii DSM 18488]